MNESSEGRESGPAKPAASPGFAAWKMARALTTSISHADPVVRERARMKVERWEQIIGAMLNGSIAVGSRTPLDAVPAWATLEVVTGGFATGQLKAGGPLLPHEISLLARVGGLPDQDARLRLNAHFLTDEGMASLEGLLVSGCYDITVPEEGALMVVAWLSKHGKPDEAAGLLEVIAPWFSSLRFFPVATGQARQLGARVSLKSVKEVILDLQAIAPNGAILRQAETIGVWIPFYDRTVSLFLETVEGDVPRVRPGADGAWTQAASGKFLVEGGWPCRHYPSGWHTRAALMLDEFALLLTANARYSWPERDKDSLAQLVNYLRRCLGDAQGLSGRDVGRIRLLLARYVTKRGEPGSPECKELRRKQAEQVKGMPHYAIAERVIARLANVPPDRGLDDAEPITRVLDDGSAIPAGIRRKVARSRIDTVQVLVGDGVIRSAEVLAVVLPQMSASINAAGFADRDVQQLYGAIYQAFRKRRSLLLLNLEKQVQLEELPWIAALEAVRERGMLPTTVARKSLEELALLALTSFPQTVVPNKLLQELRALAKLAELKLPFVEELAADIFMGEFSAKFVTAAKGAAALLAGTIYAKYYGIEPQDIDGLGPRDVPNRSFMDTLLKPVPASLADRSLLHLCEKRAGVPYTGSGTVSNAMLIEQQQILTSQNLAALVAGLNLKSELQGCAFGSARQCFEWICRRQQMKRSHWHAELIAVKNSAYAWRQMIFFLALLPHAVLNDFLVWASSHMAKQGEGFQARFLPALDGLKLAAIGRSLDSQERNNGGARRLLAYSKERHWLIG